LLSLDSHLDISQSTKSHTQKVGIPIWSNQLTQNLKISQISHKLPNLIKHTQLLLLLFTKLGIPFDLLALPQNPTPLLLPRLSYPFPTKGFFPILWFWKFGEIFPKNCNLIKFTQQFQKQLLPQSKKVVRKNMLMHTNIKKCLNRGVGNNIIT
jgi:hypothetical protein